MSEVILLCFLTVAALYDIVYAKIPNRFLIVMMIMGIGLCIYEQDYSISKVFHMIIIFFVFFTLYCMKALGAGDVKLMMAAALFLEQALWKVVLIAFFISALWGMVKLCYKRCLGSRIVYAGNYFLRMLKQQKVQVYEYGTHHNKAVTIPFALCFWVSYVICLTLH